MKKFLSILFIFCLQLTLAQEVSNYYLIRHAEKDRADSNNSNPGLTEKGHQRALHWGTVFEKIELDAIYTTNYLRTIHTAMPTADNKGLVLHYYDPRNLNSAEFKAITKGKNILIVGHSNTTPEFANAILGEEKFGPMPDHVNSYLYVITCIGQKTSAHIFTIE